MKWVIGIDIGGTKISIVLGTIKGKIVERYTSRTKHNKQAYVSVHEIISGVEKLLQKRKISVKEILGFGVGIFGVILAAIIIGFVV